MTQIQSRSSITNADSSSEPNLRYLLPSTTDVVHPSSAASPASSLSIEDVLQLISADLTNYLDDSEIATELPTKVDDLYIAGIETYIDGKGKVLGMAGPTVLRWDQFGRRRAVAGMMKFDMADIETLMESGLWTDVILHEMGHVLGIGTLWAKNRLTPGNGKDDMYRGSHALREWRAMGCSGRLPVETDGGRGTAGGHWDEKCLNGELMTGFVDRDMYLSRVTVGSLKDLGYGVNMTAADPFDKSRLGDCGHYCPEARRRLRWNGKGSSQVSKEGHQEILEAAALELERARSVGPETPDDIESFSGEMVTVYIQDTDGRVKEETITWQDVKVYRGERLNIFDV